MGLAPGTGRKQTGRTTRAVRTLPKAASKIPMNESNRPGDNTTKPTVGSKTDGRASFRFTGHTTSVQCTLQPTSCRWWAEGETSAPERVDNVAEQSVRMVLHSRQRTTQNIDHITGVRPNPGYMVYGPRMSTSSSGSTRWCPSSQTCAAWYSRATIRRVCSRL